MAEKEFLDVLCEKLLAEIGNREPSCREQALALDRSNRCTVEPSNEILEHVPGVVFIAPVLVTVEHARTPGSQ